MQTVEAVIESTGAVRLLAEVKLSKSRRALVTILGEEPIVDALLSSKQKKDKLIEAFKKAQEANIFRDIGDPVEWQRKMSWTKARLDDNSSFQFHRLWLICQLR